MRPIFSFPFCLAFMSMNIHVSKDSRGMRRPILTPLCHFHQLQEHLDIGRAITAKN